VSDRAAVAAVLTCRHTGCICDFSLTKDTNTGGTYMIGGFGVWELIIILLIVLVIFGAKKLPEIGDGIGKAISNFKKASNEPEEIDVTPKDDEKKE
jgi:sec-independent protein translocase protein TatA